MPKFRVILKYWLPVIAWMVFIFSFSSDVKSLQHSSRILEPVLRWLFPHVADETIQHLVFLARKCAHLTEYAILAWLIWRAARKPRRNDMRPWERNEALIALACVCIYATTDEIHQCFVPTRQGSPWDVLIDTAGAALGLFAIWAFGRRRKRW